MYSVSKSTPLIPGAIPTRDSFFMRPRDVKWSLLKGEYYYIFSGERVGGERKGLFDQL
jgi:hypothetical protein